MRRALGAECCVDAWRFSSLHSNTLQHSHLLAALGVTEQTKVANVSGFVGGLQERQQDRRRPLLQPDIVACSSGRNNQRLLLTPWLLADVCCKLWP